MIKKGFRIWDVAQVLCHCLAVFGQAVLFEYIENREDTASPKTPKQCKRTVNRRGGSPPPDSTNPGFVLFGTFSFLLADFIDFPPVLGVAFQPGIGE